MMVLAGLLGRICIERVGRHPSTALVRLHIGPASRGGKTRFPRS